MCLKCVAAVRSKQNDTGDTNGSVRKRWIGAKSRRVRSHHSRVFQRRYVSDFHPLSGKTQTRGSHFFSHFMIFRILIRVLSLWYCWMVFSDRRFNGILFNKVEVFWNISSFFPKFVKIDLYRLVKMQRM